MSALLDWLVEWQTALSWALLGTIAFGAILTALTTAGGIESGRREAIKVLALQKETTEARTRLEEQREKTAKAETALLSLQKFVTQPRQVDSEAVTKALKDVPKGMIEPLLYFENSGDAYLVALNLAVAFKNNGWVVAYPQPISATGNPIKSRPLGPPIGIAIETGCTRTSEGWEEPANSFFRAVTASNAESTSVAMSENRDVPKDKFIVVIGLKSW
jgi:hypothetical protein